MDEPIKPWLDFPDQLLLLERRGMRIDDRARAENYLRRIGYYRLSGYFHAFRRWDQAKQILSEEFAEGSCFERVLSLYLFDKKLRLLAWDALERIEMAVRADIVHILGKYHPMAHEFPEYFDGKFTKIIRENGQTKHQHWLDRLNELIEQAKRRQTACVVHNLQKYGRLPVWAVSGLWDFGAMSRLYEGMKHKDQNTIAQKYGAVRGDVFAQWLRSLNEIRNIAAHHDRLWNVRIVQKSAPLQKDAFWAKLDHSRPFFYFCLMQQMLNVLCPNSQWAKRFDALLGEFPQPVGKKVSLQPFGLIDDYREWPLWKQAK